MSRGEEALSKAPAIYRVERWQRAGGRSGWRRGIGGPASTWLTRSGDDPGRRDLTTAGRLPASHGLISSLGCWSGSVQRNASRYAKFRKAPGRGAAGRPEHWAEPAGGPDALPPDLRRWALREPDWFRWRQEMRRACGFYIDRFGSGLLAGVARPRSSPCSRTSASPCAFHACLKRAPATATAAIR